MLGNASAAPATVTDSGNTQYFVDNAREFAFNESVSVRGQPGAPLLLTGQLRSRSGLPLPVHARVELWHADATASPDYHPAGNGPSSAYDATELDLRGVLRTDANGRFAFRSIQPGAYVPRPRHIHFRFSSGNFIFILICDIISNRYVA